MMDQDTHKYRMMQFYKNETKGEHLQRMKKAARFGNVEKDEEPLRPMMIEHLVVPSKVDGFAGLLNRLNMTFRETEGKGKESFHIRNA